MSFCQVCLMYVTITKYIIYVFPNSNQYNTEDKRTSNISSNLDWLALYLKFGCVHI